MGGLFCDLTKAFDSVNHDVFLAKLEFYGINGSMELLIKSYMNDRYQRMFIKINNSMGISDWQKVKQGEPQGSILGPSLFLLYINKLPYLINKNSKPILYADDISILCQNSDLVEHVTVLKVILDKIHKWFVINSLSLNLNKTNYVHYSSKSITKFNTNVNYKDVQINNTLNTINYTKFLRLITDNTLSWKDQINQLVTKLSATSYSIRILSAVMTLGYLRMISFAYVYSIMSYGIFWGNSICSNSIFKIQKKNSMNCYEGKKQGFLSSFVQAIKYLALIFPIYIFHINVCSYYYYYFICVSEIPLQVGTIGYETSQV
jgi:hypothetical protein